MTQPLKRLPGELTFTCLLLVGSVFLWVQSYAISGFESITSAGMFPMLSAGVMAVTALLALRQTLRSRLDGSSDERLLQLFVRQMTPAVWVGFNVAVFAFMLLLPRLGFVFSAYVFLVLAMRMLGSTRWGFNLLLSALALGGVYLIFQTVFSVVLPKGTWLVGWGL